MVAVHELVERGVPDRIDSASLPPVLAAEIDYLAGRAEPWLDRGPTAIQARARLIAGDLAGARSLLDIVAVDELAGAALTAGCWVASRIGSPELASQLLRRLDGQPRLLFDQDIPLGPRRLFEGPLLAACGDLVAASERLRDAVDDGDARAPLWGALARVELARVLICRRVVDVGESSDSPPTIGGLEQAARLFFGAGGYRSLSTRTGALFDGEPAAGVVGAPAEAVLMPGALWTVGLGVMAPVAIRPSKGLHALHHLIEAAGRSVPAAVLDVVANDGDPADLLVRMEASVERGDGVDRLLADEPTRSRIQKLMSRTIARVSEAHPLLGAHLLETVHTGHLCRYDPPPEAKVSWRTRE